MKRSDSLHTSSLTGTQIGVFCKVLLFSCVTIFGRMDAFSICNVHVKSKLIPISIGIACIEFCFPWSNFVCGLVISCVILVRFSIFRLFFSVVACEFAINELLSKSLEFFRTQLVVAVCIVIPGYAIIVKLVTAVFTIFFSASVFVAKFSDA